jgi:MerR family transcriptional regulator, light-induced transcriptional regulator
MEHDSRASVKSASRSCTVQIMGTEPAANLRIGELSRRLGVSEHVLRAWERRYGLLEPVRSAGGFRLYTQADENRIRRMQAHLANGLSAAEAARAALAEQPAGRPGAAAAENRGRLSEASETLARALDGLDEPAAQAVLDRLLTDFTIETVLRDVLMPYLHDLGERWKQGTVNVAQEHFASNVLRGRLASLARGWGNGHGPRAVLACPPGEQHELGLLAFGIVLNRNGWRIDYLGPDTPVDDLMKTISDTHPDLVVLAAATSERLDGLGADLARLARTAPLALAGAGATRAVAEQTGARLLTRDPVTEAEQISPRSGRIRRQPRREGVGEVY